MSTETETPSVYATLKELAQNEQLSIKKRPYKIQTATVPLFVWASSPKQAMTAVRDFIAARETKDATTELLGVSHLMHALAAKETT